MITSRNQLAFIGSKKRIATDYGQLGFPRKKETTPEANLPEKIRTLPLESNVVLIGEPKSSSYMIVTGQPSLDLYECSILNFRDELKKEKKEKKLLQEKLSNEKIEKEQILEKLSILEQHHNNILQNFSITPSFKLTLPSYFMILIGGILIPIMFYSLIGKGPFNPIIGILGIICFFLLSLFGNSLHQLTTRRFYLAKILKVFNGNN